MGFRRLQVQQISLWMLALTPLAVLFQSAAVALPALPLAADREASVTAAPANRRSTTSYVPQTVLDAANRLSSTTVLSLPGLGQPDQFLPELYPQIRLVIKLGERRVYVYQRDRVKTSFPVAIGRAGWETPTGRYQVIQMQHDPVWEHPFTGELVQPGSANPLGARWIGFWTDGTNYIGFHGTPNEETVGQSISHGCVRMFNRDVIQLFDWVKLGTPVEVVP
jgi:L,D-transpeptidase ErfK/SrfK